MFKESPAVKDLILGLTFTAAAAAAATATT